jgi:putative ABC transport system permease protein
MVAALHRKLFRDLFRLQGQVLTIALVVAAGIASFVALRSTLSSLESSRSLYEAQYHFGDIFAHAERVPDEVGARLLEIQGVASVYTRVLERVSMPLDTMVEPANGRLISLPDGENAPLNAVYLRAGRFPEAGRSREVVLLSSFAESHALRLGDSVPLLVQGRLYDMQVVGLGMAEGDMAPDDERFFVAWMNESAVNAMYDMRGAFNDVVVDLQPGASGEAVIEEMDRWLVPFGSNGAFDRDGQLSSHAVDSEMSQLRVMATAVPILFLLVAAFLLNVVLGRLVQLQRPQIAALKALGYSNIEIGTHFLLMMMVVVVVGSVLGIAAGVWLGTALTNLYGDTFRFPILRFRLHGAVVVISLLISLVAAVAGALQSVRQVVVLPAAEAMRPEAPGIFRKGLLDWFRISQITGTAVRMVTREMASKPWRLGFSVTAIAMAGAILVVGRFSADAFDYMMEIQFQKSWREDVTVTFMRPVSMATIQELNRIPGVLEAEGIRAVGARVRHLHYERDVPMQWMNNPTDMRELWDIDEVRFHIPPHGVLMTTALATALHLRPGDTFLADILEGQRPQVQLRVVGTVVEPFGMQVYLSQELGMQLANEPPLANMALLRIDPQRADEVQDHLQEIPGVLTSMQKFRLISRFRDQTGKMMFSMTLILTVLASTIAVGVVYNNARIALSMRGRDLASLRVLGFTRSEIAVIFHGEIALQVLLAIPPGILVGRWISIAVAKSMNPEIFRLPLITSNETILFVSAVLMGSGIVSSLLVNGRLNNLDLIAVLKARE